MPVTSTGGETRKNRYYKSPSRVSPPMTSTFVGPFGIPMSITVPRGQPVRPTPRPPFRSPEQLGVRSGMQEHGARSPQRGYVPQLQRQVDPLTQLLNELLGIAGGGFGGPSEEQLIAQARAQAAAQFDPQIAAVQAAIENAKSETDRNKAGVEQLYEALAASYPADIQAAKQTYQEAIGREKNIAESSEAAIAASYAQSQQQLVDTLQKLGIEEAAPGILPELTEDQAMVLSRAAERSGAEQSAYGRKQTAAEAYYGQGPSLARLGGTQAQDFLVQQLNQFVLQQEAQRAQLEAQRSLTENALFGELQMGAQNAAQQQAMQQFNMIDTILGRQLDIGRFGLEQQRLRQSQLGEQPELPTSGTSGAAAILGQMVGQARGAQLLNDLYEFMAEVASSRLQQPNFQQSLAALRNFAEDKEYSPADINALINALAAVYDVYR